MRQLLFVLLFAFALGCQAADPPAPWPVLNSLADLRPAFARPPAGYSTAPFLVWNGDVTEKETDAFLADYKAHGVTSIIVHPRLGLITPYLSERWFALMRYTVNKAKSLGMLVWLYDENGYPSGTADGRVRAEMPESWNQGQGLVLKKLSAAKPQDLAGCKVLLRKSGDRFERAAASSASGEVYCFALASYGRGGGESGYVDLLKPGVTQKFIEITMPGYEKSIGADFGKTVPGIFTDEPEIRAPVHKNGIRWTPDLFEQFQKRFGYDLTINLPSLIEETGNWRKVRHDYYALLLDLFIDRWSKPWYNYTQSKLFLWTGHYWEHSWPSPEASPDHVAMYAWHQVPGVDMLGNQFNEGVNVGFGNVRSVKEVASVANQMGRRRKLSETYGTAGWDMRFEDLKRLGDWEYVLGINLMNQHLSWMYSMGDRKTDYPPTFSYQNPWWKHYTVLAEYFARLSAALSTGEEINRILVLEPTTSAWLYASPDAPVNSGSGVPTPPLPSSASAATKNMVAIGSAFQAFVTRLQYLQVEYDIGSEHIIRDRGKTSGVRFVVGQRSYDVVIIPPGMENLESSTLRLLDEYTKQGGKVLAFSSPAFVDGAPSARQWKPMSSLDDPQVRSSLVPSDIASANGPMFHQRRKLKDGELLFFANDSLDRPASAELRLKGPSVVRLDPVTGRLEQYAARRVELPPAGSLLLYAGSAKVDAPAPPPFGNGEPVAAAGAAQVRRLEPNMITLDYCDLKIGGKTESGLYYYRAVERVSKLPADSGFELTYRFTAEELQSRSTLRAVVERPQLWKMAVNGKPLAPRPGEWAIDRAFGVYDIGAAVKGGENTLTLTALPMRVEHEVTPVYITGDFGVTAQPKGFKLVPSGALALGSWKTQGLPFYPGDVAYARDFKLEAKPARYMVRLGRWSGTVADVRVNGKSAGIIGWQPYECDITSLVRPGVNRVEVVVTGSNQNLQGPLHGNPAPGRVGPADFHSGPGSMPAGTAYRQVDYGLMQDFQVLRSSGR